MSRSFKAFLRAVGWVMVNGFIAGFCSHLDTKLARGFYVASILGLFLGLLASLAIVVTWGDTI